MVHFLKIFLLLNSLKPQNTSRILLKLFIFALPIFIIFNSSGCKSGNSVKQDEATVVRVEENSDSFSLFVNDEPFYIKGAGGQDSLDLLVKRGGNSIRTWGLDNAQSVLDEASKRGLMVTMGLWVGHERHGFNYNNDEAVQTQLENFRMAVKQFKDHPALLMWGVGNEMELNASNMKVWDAVNDIAEMIKEEDPNHPTVTVVAEISEDKINRIKNQVPAIDILGINSYGGLGSIPDRVRRFGWEKPYIVTEWGVNGHWEVGKTSWDAPIEPTSTRKAEIIRDRYENVISTDTEQCLGSYVFLWGEKQERTPTWHGLFLYSGHILPGIDVMQRVWTGEWPANRAPEIESITLQGRSPNQSVRIQVGKVVSAKLVATDPDDDQLTYDWYILKESTSNASGGDAENRPDEVEGIIISIDNDGTVNFSSPDETGAYRLFAEVFDGNGHAGVANIPFYVDL